MDSVYLSNKALWAIFVLNPFKRVEWNLKLITSLKNITWH